MKIPFDLDGTLFIDPNIVDDDIFVAQNGKIYGFRVFLLNDNDSEWVTKLWAEIKRIKHMISG